MNSTEDWKEKDPNKETSEKWKNDPKNWIWGILYYNKDDKRLFVLKKKEWMGTALNFTNPKWILFMIGFILFYSFIVFMMIRKH